MGISRRQKTVLRRELRSLVYQLAMMAGIFGGLLWALNLPEQPPPASCSSSGRGDNALNECAGDALLNGMLPYLAGMTLGALGGFVVAVVVARVLLPAPRRSSHRAAAPARWITARYSGRCAECRADIEPGDRIRHARGWTVCRHCAA